MIKLTVESLYGGGAVERFHGELEKAIANIVDPNTPAKKPRKVKLEMIIKPNEHRNMAEVLVTTSCSLQSPQPLETSIYIGADPRTGEIGASEMVSGENPEQHTFPGTMETGGKILKLNKGVVNA
jgi:hypothetical protein